MKKNNGKIYLIYGERARVIVGVIFSSDILINNNNKFMSMFGDENSDLNDAHYYLNYYMKRMIEENREQEALENIMYCVGDVLKNNYVRNNPKG
jgi:hypothetical protein